MTETNPKLELVSKHKKTNMRKSEFLMLEELKSAPHPNDNLTLRLFFGSCLHSISEDEQ
jgi:hypothetical protein